MSGEALAVLRAQALAQWGPERRDAAMMQLVRELAGADVTAAARLQTGRTVEVRLSDLLSPSARLAAAPSAPPPDEMVPDLSQRALLAARSGGSLTAVVLEALPGGAYKVAVADARLMLELPDGLQPGEMVFLKPKGEAAALARQPAAAPALPSAVVADLGTTAQLLSRLAASASAGEAPAPIITRTPLSGEAGNATRIAAGLKDAIVASGLFYESHLADWIDGVGSKSGLMREPQAALGRTDHPVAPQAEPLVQRQLDMLEHRTALWQGEAWPGQAAEVRITEDESGAQGSAANEPPAWQASLRVSMPGLGDLEARVALSGRRARLVLSAADPASAGKLSGARADLARALGEQGLTLAEARIEHHGSPARSR